MTMDYGVLPTEPRTSGMPTGYFYDAVGAYKLGPGGVRVPVSSEEIIAAANAETAAARGGGAVAPSNKQVTQDERTGEAIVIDPRTGTITRTGEQIGFAGVDPRETAAATEQRAAQERALTARQQSIDLLKQSQNALQRAAEAAEAAKVDRAKLKSQEAIANAQLKEQARAADLRAAVDQYQTALNLIPALGQLSLDESKRVQDVLSNGSDFLARAFESRGGTSPLAKVLQADQIGAVGGAISTLRGMIQDAISQSPMAKGGGFQPVEFTQVDGYTPTDFSQASSTGFPGGPPGVAPVNDPGPYRYSAPAAIQPVAAPAPAAGGGGFAGAVQAAAPSPPPAPAASLFGPMDEMPNAFEGQEGTGPGFREVQLQQKLAETPGAEMLTLQNGTGVFTPWEKQNKLNAAKYAAGEAVIGAAKSATKPFQWLYEQTPAYKRSQGVPGYAEGTGDGFTRAHMMMVGDSESGRPTGHEEVVVNPTNAPIQVIPNEQARGFMGAMPRYATGTGGLQRLANGMYYDPTGQIADQDRSAPVSTSGGGGGFATVTKASGRSYLIGSGSGVDQFIQSQGGFMRPAAPTVRPAGPTQADLVAMSQANLPPAVRAALEGRSVPARQSLASTVDPSKYLRPMTSRQLNSLDPQELKALGTATNVEFNAPLDYVTGQTARQYGASQQRRSGFAGAMGL